jgi:hypothetical protein
MMMFGRYSMICLPLLAALAWPLESIAADSKPAVHQPRAERDGSHDFDLNFGTWKTHITRLARPLSGSTTWNSYDGISVVCKIWNGQASLFELDANGPAGHLEGAGLRLYNPQSHQWSLNWTNSGEGKMEVPMTGDFHDGRGEFFDQEWFNGRAILSRNGFSDIRPNSSRFEQAFSDDGGKTWEVNWVMTFTRMPGKANEGNCS